MGLLAAVVVAAVASLVVWWLGREVLAHREGPLLAERWWRYRIRTAQIGAAATVLVMVLAGRHGLWLVPALWVGILAARFRCRRQVLAERRSFGQYLAWTLRLMAALGGLPILIAMTPLVVAASGVAWPAVTAVLAAVAAAYLLGSRRVVLALLEARPLAPDDAPAVAAAAGDIAARSTVPAPELYRTDAGGGRWYNALALADNHRVGAVVLSTPLIDAFEPRQLAAVLAHEVSHLEHLTPRRVRRRAVVLALLAVAALVLVPVDRMLVELPFWAPLAWWWAIVLGLVVASARHRSHETASDLRAVELCGDAEAVASALSLLHQLNLFPRRLEATEDASQSHPSLARRLQAIRALDSADCNGLQQLPPMAVRGGREGQWVVLEQDRISWLDGVPGGIEATPNALRIAAAAIRSLEYQQLYELRVSLRRGGRSELVAVACSGERTVVTVDGAAVEALQQALDRVDGRLAPPRLPPALAPFARVGAPLRWLAGLTALLSLMLPAGFVNAAVLLVAALRPRTSSLVAGATAAVGAGALAWLRPGYAGRPVGPTPLIIVLVMLVGLLLAGAAAARAILEPHGSGRGGRVMALVLTGAAAMVWGWALASTRLGAGGLSAYRLHSAVLAIPATLILPACAAVVLVTMPGRRARAAGVTIGVLLAPAVWLGSSDFRNRFAVDLLISRSAPATIAVPALERLHVAAVAPNAAAVRIAPNGGGWAVGSYRGFDETTGRVGYGWRLTTADGRQMDEVSLADLRFAADGRALGLRHPDPRSHDLAVGVLPDTGWRVDVGELVNAELGADSLQGRWWVTGIRLDGPGERGFIRVAGGVDEAASRRTVWTLDAGRTGALWAALDERVALAALWGDDELVDMPAPLWMFAPLRGTRRVVAVAEGHVQQLGATSLELRCAAHTAGAVCVAWDRWQLELWRVTAVDSGIERLPLGSVTGHGFPLAVEPAAGGVTLVVTSQGELLGVAPDGGGISLLVPPGGGRVRAASFAMPDRLAVLHDDGVRVRLSIMRWTPTPSWP